MSQSLRTASSGLLAQQQRIDVIANNIANINTAGYKSQRLDFSDALYSAMQDPTEPVDAQTGNLLLGQGVMKQAVIRDGRVGPLEITGQPLDFALDGQGYFQVETADGSIAFTRMGAFKQAVLNDQFFLVTAAGDFVLDANGQRISSSESLANLSVNEGGQIMQDGSAIAQLGVFKFADTSSLQAIGNSTYLPSAASGEPVAARTSIRQGALEGSNVSLADEMTRLIQAQRAYSLMSRAVTTADQMRANENDIRR